MPTQMPASHSQMQIWYSTKTVHICSCLYIFSPAKVDVPFAALFNGSMSENIDISCPHPICESLGILWMSSFEEPSISRIIWKILLATVLSRRKSPWNASESKQPHTSSTCTFDSGWSPKSKFPNWYKILGSASNSQYEDNRHLHHDCLPWLGEKWGFSPIAYFSLPET